MCKKGQVAACILYVTNGITLLLSLVGLGLGIWLLVSNTAVTNSVPDYLAIAIVIIMVLIAFIAGLGVFATVAQMKENNDTDPTTGKKLGEEGCCTKDCCNSCGISLYSFFSIIGSFMAFGMGIVAVYYSGALPAQLAASINATAGATVDSWFSSLDNYIDDKVFSLIATSISRGGSDWMDTQNLLGCCGWNSTTADATVLTGDCCTNANGTNAALVDSLSGDTFNQLFNGDLAITFSTCNTVGGAVMTCKGLVYYQTQTNLLTIGIVLLVIWFVLLACFICALKVRYCSGGQGDAQVEPSRSSSKAPSVKPTTSSQVGNSGNV